MKKCLTCEVQFKPNRGQLYCLDCKRPKIYGGLRIALLQIIHDSRATPQERMEAIHRLESKKGFKPKSLRQKINRFVSNQKYRKSAKDRRIPEPKAKARESITYHSPEIPDHLLQ